MKDLQGKMIDASKSGLFDQVVVPEVIKLKFRKKPQFMFFKDGNEFNKDYSTKSALDFFADRMQQFKEYVNRVMREDTNRKIKVQRFENIYNYLMNPELDGEVVQKVIEDLDDVYSTLYRKTEHCILKSESIHISDDIEKYCRPEVQDLYERHEWMQKICGCPSLLATASVRMTYINTNIIIKMITILSVGLLLPKHSSQY